MAFTWQSPDHKRSGVDDMTLLPKVDDASIVENLKKRFDTDWIFTYIGPVLVSVNPFKQMKYFTQRETDMYQGAAQYENPPHIYALADQMYRNMTSDLESQCVIISGESGAGKTVCAKFIMNYLSQVSGSGNKAQKIKDVILQSNPVLEAFGNAKTVRNNNSSRFGKYVEILFQSGMPGGGKVRNFLLEKSRVVGQNPQERNFHVFYQCIDGISAEMRNDFGITEADYYNYLNEHNCYTVDGTDDKKDFEEMAEAMVTIGLDEDERSHIFSLVFGILHLGNVIFEEEKNDEAVVKMEDLLDYPCNLLQVDKEFLATKLTSRVMKTTWGGNTEEVVVTNNIQQAESTRDALAKGIYSRIFDFLVERINLAMEVDSKSARDLLTLGILDIYGFEIFQNNGFEQFCINYVNEKLQQIFIELTLKAEQEEYVQEGISWKEINYFNNKVVCSLIEDKAPKPGIMAVLDDVCASQHGQKAGADQNLKGKLADNQRQNKYFEDWGMGFAIHHYAGIVRYNVEGFCEKNKDVFYDDLIELMQSSSSEFIRKLFPENLVEKAKNRKRPITGAAKIKSQANDLVTSLMASTPSYVRTIKPNETKLPGDWDNKMVLHQCEYLGLKENIRIRRAGFAYRRAFEKFLQRYAILTKETWPRWSGSTNQGVIHILKSVNMNAEDYQLGKSKLFVKAPESLFLLEEQRDKIFDTHARVIQKTFKKYFNSQLLLRQKEEAADLFHMKKERRQHSLNRTFYSDYIGLDDAPGIRSLIGKREKIEFAQSVQRYDRKFRGLKIVKRDLIVTQKGIFIIGREKVKTGPNTGQFQEVVSRNIPFPQLFQISLSTRQDDFIVLHVAQSHDSLLQVPFKTEFVSVVSKLKEEKTNINLKLFFSDKVDFMSDKTALGAGKKRTLNFTSGPSPQENIVAEGMLKSALTVSVAQGLSNDSRPSRSDTKANARKNRAGGNNKNQGGQSRPKAGPGAPLPAVPANTGYNNKVNSENIYNEATSPGGRNQMTRQPSRKAPGVSDATPRGRISFKAIAKSSTIAQPNMDHLRQQLQNQQGGYRKSRKVSRDEQNYSNFQLPQREAGNTHESRAVIRKEQEVKPLPAGGRPKPAMPKKLARARVVYSYTAADTDEIDISESEVIEIVLEDPSGWWRGKKTNGEEGLFPGTYVEKM